MIIKLFSNSHTDIKEQVFVYSVLAFMMLLAISFMIHYSSRMPLAEDWLMIGTMTGFEGLQNLWLQVNEHRVPFPRLIYLLLLLVTGGDFRVGGYFNILLFGFISLLMILTARSLRGGRSILSDSFFPIAWLHLGHAANLLMGWQITQVVPTIIVSIFLLLFITQKSFATPNAAILSSLSLILLPLCGANGLLYVPFLGLWLSLCGILTWRASQNNHKSRVNSEAWISLSLVGSSLVTFGISIFYFVNYYPPAWSPPSPSLIVSLKTGIKLLAYSWGPCVSSFWAISGAITVILLFLGLALIFKKIFQTKGINRYQAIGILCFFTNLILFSLVVGHSRAGWIPDFGLPQRYVVFAVPTLSAVFLISELYGTWKVKNAVQRFLCLGMLILLPFNIISGFYGFTNWYRQEATAMKNDIFAGYSAHALAVRWANNHDDFVLRLKEPEVESYINMLRVSGVEPFTQIKASD